MPDLPAGLKASLDATKVEYRRLGNSGLKVSVPIFGCMSFGDSKAMSWVVDEAEALPLLKAAYDRGINTWDTANVYSQGASERIIGKAIRQYEIPREKLVIATKCFWAPGEQADVRHVMNASAIEASKDYVNNYHLSRTAIFNQVDASLKRLQLDYIDLLQIHRFDAATPLEETMRALHDLVQSGKVRYIGASSMWATQFARMQFVAEKNGCKCSMAYRLQRASGTTPHAPQGSSQPLTLAPILEPQGQNSFPCRTTTTCFTARRNAR